ncbi:MAG: adenylate/guanylate cyclase domain-containing protein [Aureibaculum sp.]|nr:adenylate/guanylate cyclase domain-containing protein [Aureibaculum sp.]
MKKTNFSINYLKIKAYVLIGFFLISSSLFYGQNKFLSDSLENIYEKGEFDENSRLKILYDLAEHHIDPEKKLRFSIELIETAQELDSMDKVFSGYLQKGTAYRKKGELSNALESYLHAAKVANDNNLRRLGIINITIADVYSLMENHSNAIQYYDKAITILRVEKDSILLATALINAGDEAFSTKNYDLSLKYFKESGQIFKEMDYLIGTAYNLGNMGMIFAEQEKNSLAESNINEAIVILEKLGDYPPICEYLIYMADIYLKKGNIPRTLNYATRSHELAQQYKLKKQLGDANLKLSEIYEKTGDEKKSLTYYKDYIVYRDSVKNIEAVQKQANLETQYQVAQNQIKSDYEISQKQTEVDLLSQQKKNQRIVVIATAIALLLIGLLAIGLLRRNKFIERTKKIIEEEKDRSDNLLLNILPEETAQELKENGKVLAKQFDAVTVLFTDFKGFTKYSENLSPQDLVETIDFYFSKFDEILEKHGLEKIKTIGDAYMCAGGLPFPSKNHAHKMIRAAFEIAEFVDETKKNENESGKIFDIRIGINSGPVVAGVVGSKKFAYDIWGDTVNVASRMESMSEPGKINISENTYALIKEDFNCEYRGEIEAKNRGKLKMYFVNDTKV